jgi:hypothetical protein
MLEALTDIVPLRDSDELRQLHLSTKRLQQASGNMRDLEAVREARRIG